MAEKGGKGFSLPKGGGKSSLKSPGSLKGKDDSSAKSNKGWKVQFDSEGDFGKGGKGGKVANGGKNPVPKESSKLELKVEQELSKDAKCLMDCEATDILQGIQEQMAILSEDPNIKIPVAFDRGLQYAKSGSHYMSPQSVRQILEPLKTHGVADSEICMIANTCPESVDVAFALIPSLQGKKNKLTESLKDALNELAEQLKD